MLEREYQAKLIKKLYKRFPGVFIIKNDPEYIQGIPDLTLLFPNGFWAELEVKPDPDAKHQPNQDYYIEKFNRMSYAAFIDPENEEDILSDLQRAYEATWKTRGLQR